MRGSFFRNLGYSFFAQAIQLVLSIVISFLLPKMLGVEEFGFWQLFIFYSQFAGFFHFGLVDGIYLREGGQLYKNLDFDSLGYQLRILFLVDFVLILLTLPWIFSIVSYDRIFVLVSSCIFILISNLISFFALTMQSVNEIRISSLGRLFFSVPFLAIVLLEYFVLNNYNFRFYIICYIATNCLTLVYYFFNAKEILFRFITPSSQSRRHILIENIKNGLILTLANITGMLILGFGRFMIDKHWGVEQFSVVSFALVIVNFVLMFISQVSLVLYPELRSIGFAESERIYGKLSSSLSCISPFFYFLFILWQ